ncbi:hypothetical protein CDD81_5038 [Ophiocordyceps australis]|uniref:MAT1-1-2 n=1 Tax=Ophiocordyceps australis TaxID=1399860 RepID=A0A2C5Y3I0_9HYPO|nr:hypothetical protein CDD81_5038 [Ophiocordyceps australis]
MESICSFEPFWAHSDVIQSPKEAIDDIQKRVIYLYLNHYKNKKPEPLNIKDAIKDCTAIIKALVKHPKDGNTILNRLSTTSGDFETATIDIVQGALAMWYTSIVPAVIRDEIQVCPAYLERRVNENGEPFLRWNRELAREQLKNANLGLTAYFIAFGSWVPPQNPLLRTAILMSRSVSTILYAAFLLAPEMYHEDLKDLVRSTKPEETMGLYIKSIWSLAREDFDQFDASAPGAEFGATLDEVKLTRGGSKLLTNIGRGKSWYTPPYHHPLITMPGSPWGKFLRNHNRPFFTPPSSADTSISFRWPSSLDTLVAPYKEIYTGIRERLDSRGIPRKVLSEEEQAQQFERLSKATGLEYPNMEISEDTAAAVEQPEQDYLHLLPTIKQPITDGRGHLTFSFANAALRAMRFSQDPDEVDPDFRILTIEHKGLGTQQPGPNETHQDPDEIEPDFQILSIGHNG